MSMGEKRGIKSGKTRRVLRVRNSRKIYIPIYIMILILILTISAAKFSGKEVNTFAFKTVLIFSATAIIFTELHRLVNSYEVNSNSLVISTRLIKNSTRRLDLLSISDADSVQGPWERILNYGDVHVRLFSKESTMTIKGIDNPLKFVDFLIETIDEKRGGGVDES